MTPDQWRRAKELFHSALERASGQRTPFLDDHCDDEVVRGEVERLLVAHRDAGTFIEPPTADTGTSRHDVTSLSGRTLGHYHVQHLVGAGGMGAVYSAVDTELQRRVALKVVTGQAIEASAQLRREAQRASQLNHPHVCTIHEAGVADGLAYFVMEFVEGETLSALIARGPLPAETVVRYGLQIADALAHAHERGVIHRDLKSTNVMVTLEGRAKILDFGLATLTPERTADVSRTRTALSYDEPLAGTLSYMAPEILRLQPADARSDIWALGVVLYEIATGRRSFEGVTGFELSGAILHEPPAVFGTRMPALLEATILRALAKDRHERFARARDVAAALEAVRVGLTNGAGDRSGQTKRSVDGRQSGSLPVLRTSFIGRTGEVERLARELGSSRLVTLTGVGGSGKTRLALRLAEQVGTDAADGVWWVDLTPVSEPRRVDEIVAGALGVLSAQRAPREALLDFLSDRHSLLVLDNCEHVIAAASDLADALLDAADQLSILATSREALGIAGERVLPVPSLSFPSADAGTDARAVAESDAGRLFMERAKLVHADFNITPANASVVIDICRRLDGIPLALELAAAHARVLTMEQIRDRLRDRLSFLAGHGRRVARHQTLGAALQWSYDLLTREEQHLLRCLSVIQGGWGLSAAIGICGDTIDGHELLGVLWRLVDKSLVEVIATDQEEARYRLLEMVREFASERLGDAHEATEARARHAAYYLARLEGTAPELFGPREVDAASNLDRDLDNVLTALGASVRDGGAERVARAVADSWSFWVARGHLVRGRALLSDALHHAREPMGHGCARGLMATSMFARFAGDGPTALSAAAESISVHERLDPRDDAGLAFALFQQETARVSFANDYTGVQALQYAAALWRDAGDHVTLSLCLNMLGVVAQHDADYDMAESTFREALSVARQLKSPYLTILFEGNLGLLCVDQLRWSDAVPFLRSALQVIKESGNRHFGPGCVLAAARIVALSGDLSAAARLSGAAVGMAAQIGETFDAADGDQAERQLVSLGLRPDDEEYARLRTAGGQLTFNAAIDEALATLERLPAS